MSKTGMDAKKVEQIDTQANAAPRVTMGLPAPTARVPTQAQSVDAINARSLAHNAVPENVNANGRMSGSIDNPDPGRGVVTDISGVAATMGTTNSLSEFFAQINRPGGPK